MNTLDLFAMLTGPEAGYRATYFRGQLHWVEARDLAALARRMDKWAWEGDLEVGACQWVTPEFVAARPSHVLWAEVNGPKPRRALKRFNPAPSLVLAAGARRTAFWALSQGLEPKFTIKLNRRIAHAVGGMKKHAELDFRFHPPGTIIRGRGRDVPVVVKRWDRELHSARAVAGNLPDPPDPDAWREFATGRS